jgi:hypothetical protein
MKPITRISIGYDLTTGRVTSLIPHVVMRSCCSAAGNYAVYDACTNRLMGYSQFGTHLDTGTTWYTYKPPIQVHVVETIEEV